MTQPNLGRIAGQEKALLEMTEGSQVPTRHTCLARETGSGLEAIHVDSIQLRRALARWENEGGARGRHLQRI